MPFPLLNLKLERPLAVLDLETTGVDPGSDRIVEVGVLKLSPGRRARSAIAALVHPGLPIPAAATTIHGITDEDVADRPRFRRIAPGLARLLEGADLAGFNLRRFDLPLLTAEFRRAGVAFAHRRPRRTGRAADLPSLRAGGTWRRPRASISAGSTPGGTGRWPTRRRQRRSWTPRSAATTTCPGRWRGCTNS